MQSSNQLAVIHPELGVLLVRILHDFFKGEWSS